MTIETQIYMTEEQNIKSLWTALKIADKQCQSKNRQFERSGLQFGEAMYKYRDKHSAQGRRTDLRATQPCNCDTKSETFEEFCDRLDIVRMTAYRWIARYEDYIKTRPEVPTPTTHAAQASQASTPVTPPTPVVTPPAPPPTRTKEDVDREGLQWLVNKRLPSVLINFQQVLDNKSKWSKHPEYAEIVALGKQISALVELL